MRGRFAAFISVLVMESVIDRRRATSSRLLYRCDYTESNVGELLQLFVTCEQGAIDVVVDDCHYTAEVAEKVAVLCIVKSIGLQP